LICDICVATQVVQDYLRSEMSAGKRFSERVNVGAVSALIETVRADVESLVPALEALLFPGGAPAHLDLAAVLRAFGEILERDLAALTASEDLLRGHGGAAGRDREVAVESLRAALLRVRSLLMAAFGPGAVSRCGLSNPVPDAPEPLLVYARFAAQALARSAPGHAQPAPFATLDLGGAAAFLREHIDVLDAALGAADARRREQLEARHERQAGDLAQHIESVTSLLDVLASLVHRDARPTRKRSVTEELPPLAAAGALRGA
jgi:hypothetical protein